MASGGNGASRVLTVLLAVVVLGLAASMLVTVLRPRFGNMRTHGAAHRVIRVQVLNGSGEGGMGSRVASMLREGGFHVVEVGNADRYDYFTTVVVARTEDPGPAKAIARYLGGPPVLRQAWTSDLAEVTVVVGRDRARLRLGD